jgi:23S rRNA (guanosine2251-2'-O)-methyltransferase
MAVLETLHAGRWPVLELRLSENLAPDELDHATRLAERLDIPVLIEPAASLTRTARSPEHQGYLAKMPPFPYERAEDLLRENPASGFYVVLDAVQDPYNFGAILRSADAFGVDGIFVGRSSQSQVTSLVVRASSGAVNHSRLAQVDDLAGLLERLRQAGVSLVGTAPQAKHDISNCDFCRPIAIVLGNEAIGIRPELLALCDVRVSIRQRGHVGSLNAAVSAGIVFYEVLRQRGARVTGN